MNDKRLPDSELEIMLVACKQESLQSNQTISMPNTAPQSKSTLQPVSNSQTQLNNELKDNSSSVIAKDKSGWSTIDIDNNKTLELVSPVPTGIKNTDAHNEHNVVYFAAAKGADIVAAAGTVGEIFNEFVTSTEEDTKTLEFGRYIEIDHGNGVKTFYAHCDEVLVKEGDVVEQGKLIAKVGNTGMTTGNCCRFELSVDDEAIKFTIT